jgi:hypothetical protein
MPNHQFIFLPKEDPHQYDLGMNFGQGLKNLKQVLQN